MKNKFSKILAFIALAPLVLVLGVTPKNITLFFRGRSGRTYVKNAYVSDVAAAPITFAADGGVAGAGQDTFWILPEDMKLIDVSTVAGPTVIFNLQPILNTLPIGDILDYASHLNSLATRPSLSIGPMPSGSKFALVQR